MTANAFGALSGQGTNRSGNVVMKFSSRLQIDPMLFRIGGRGTAVRSVATAFRNTQSADVSDHKCDYCHDQPKYDFHRAIHIRGIFT
jgi:hypothetical protein